MSAFRSFSRMAAGLAAAVAVGSTAFAQDPIAIGMSVPLSGGAAFLGQHEKWGAELAITEINESGGVLGRPLELRFQDNQCNPSQGVTSVGKLLSGDVSAIIGGLCSSVTLAIMPIVAREQIPLVVGVSTSKAITDESGIGGNEWTFRINPSDAGLAVALANYLAERGDVTTIAFVGEDTDYGRGGHAALVAALEPKGIKVVSADFYQKNTPDFTTVLTKLRFSEPDAIALYGVGADELNFLRQYRRMGLPIPLTGRVAFSELPDSLLKSGALDGNTSVFPYAAELETKANREFVRAFKERFGEGPNYQSFEGYEAVRVIAEAIERAGSAEPGAIRDALEATRYRSLTGQVVEFDDHNQAHNAAIIMKINDGEIVIDGLADT